MTTATQTLTDFLLARIADDEAGARSATDGPWVAEMVDGDVWGQGNHERICRTSSYVYGPDASHIARHNPARVLAQCAAFRAIVEEHGANQCRVDPCDAHDASFRTVPCPTLRALASIWREHDEFQEAWL